MNETEGKKTTIRRYLVQNIVCSAKVFSSYNHINLVVWVKTFKIVKINGKAESGDIMLDSRTNPW